MEESERIERRVVDQIVGGIMVWVIWAVKVQNPCGVLRSC